MSTYVYLMDEFHPVDIPFNKLVELYDKNPLKIFDLIKPLVERIVGEVSNIEFYNSFLSHKSGSALIEYMVEVKDGRMGVKVIYAKDPGKALMKYYGYEKKT